MELNPDHKGPLGDTVSYNKIIWIDSDIEWTPEQFFKIYNSDYDVVSGAYIVADEITTSVHAWGTPGGIPIPEILKMTKPLKVQSIGFGFVGIKSGIFERIQRPWFKMFDQSVYTSNGNQIVDSIGEDISWCIKAYQSGIEIYFDPTVLVNHMKKRAIKWPK
jgi:hypothetical protein